MRKRSVLGFVGILMLALGGCGVPPADPQGKGTEVSEETVTPDVCKVLYCKPPDGAGYKDCTGCSDSECASLYRSTCGASGIICDQYWYPEGWFCCGSGACPNSHVGMCCGNSCCPRT